MSKNASEMESFETLDLSSLEEVAGGGHTRGAFEAYAGLGAGATAGMYLADGACEAAALVAGGPLTAVAASGACAGWGAAVGGGVGAVAGYLHGLSK